MHQVCCIWDALQDIWEPPCMLVATGMPQLHDCWGSHSAQAGRKQTAATGLRVYLLRVA